MRFLECNIMVEFKTPDYSSLKTRFAGASNLSKFQLIIKAIYM